MKTNVYHSFILLTLFFWVCEKTNAQSPDWLWAKAIGGTLDDRGYSIAIDASGNVYTTGYFQGIVDFDPGPGTSNLTSNGSTDIFISKSDGSGNFIWAKQVGGTGDDYSQFIALDDSGNVFTTGSFQGTVDFDPGAGVSNLTSAGFEDIFIYKSDSSGNFVWTKAMGGSGEGRGYSLALNPAGSGDIYITGWFWGTVDFDPGAATSDLTSAGNYDIFVSKINSAGNFVWAKRMGGTSDDRGYSITADVSGNVYTTGKFSGTADFDPGTSAVNFTSAGADDIFISKLNGSGNFIWAKVAGGADMIYGDNGNCITLDASGNVYTTGIFSGTVDFDPGSGTSDLTATGYRDGFISKLDGLGNFVWAKQIGGTSYNNGLSIFVDHTGSGDVYTAGIFSGTTDFDPGAGTFNLTSGGADIFISKLDSLGNFIWAKAIDSGTSGYSSDGLSITLDAFSNVYLTGAFFSPSFSMGSTILTNSDNTGSTSDILISRLDTLATGIESVESNNVISVYPNPANELLVISYSLLGNKKVAITITDITGKIIYLIASAESQNLAPIAIGVNTSNFSEGIYLVQVKSEDFIETKKIIVVK